MIAYRLTDKQEAFVQELIKGKSQREAYRIAYPKSEMWEDHVVDVKACELLKNGKVMVRYEELQGKVLKQSEEITIATAQQILQEITAIGMGNKKYPSYDASGKKYEREPSIAMRLKALELLGKHLNLFTDQIYHTGDISIEVTVDED